MPQTTTTPATDRTAGAATPSTAVVPRTKTQGIATDQFFYFFLRLRKGEVRRVVQRAKTLYPKDSTEKLARRLIFAQSSLALVGGAILYVPQLFPAAGSLWKMAGLVGGSSMLARMNLYLILEIALLYGEDIDDRARVPEMMAVVAASGLSAASPLLVSSQGWPAAAAIPASALSASAVASLVGESAIAFYRARQTKRAAAPAAAGELAAAPA